MTARVASGAGGRVHSWVGGRSGAARGAGRTSARGQEGERPSLPHRLSPHPTVTASPAGQLLSRGRSSAETEGPGKAMSVSGRLGS